MSLTLEDLALVLEELHDARKKWYEIGLQLKLQVEDLESISSENKNNQTICLRRVLITWMKSGKANWSTLGSVLTNRTVDEKVLAEELQKKYPTNQSRLPSQGEKAQTPSTQEKTVPSTSSQKVRGGNANVSMSSSNRSDLPKIPQKNVGETKIHKRKSETPVPSAAKKTKPEFEFKLPDSLSIEIFARRPPPDHYCMKCVPSKVPLNPHRTQCCQKLYCEPCSKKTKKCSNRKHHNQELRFTINKDLKEQITKLKLKSCCNPGCDWPGGEVYKLKNHLPQCDHATKKGQKKREQTAEVPEVSSSNNTSKARAERSNLLASELTSIPLSMNDVSLIENLRVEEVQNYAQAVFSPPVNLIMNQVSSYQNSTAIWRSNPFISHQLGYKLNVAVRFDPKNPTCLELALGSAQSSQNSCSHLKFPCIGDATLKILNPNEDKHHIKIHMGFSVTAEPTNILKFPEGGSFESIPRQFIHEDSLHFQVVEIHLDDKYKPWLLHPTNTQDSDSDVNCSDVD